MTALDNALAAVTTIGLDTSILRYEMTALTVEQLYAQQIRSRSPQERLRLLKLMVSDLTEKDVAEDKPKRSILELEGLGADDPVGMDAQEYVNQLRAEWDHRP